MKILLYPLTFLLSLFFFAPTTVTPVDSDADVLKKIYKHTMTSSYCYGNLEEICTDVGARLSGSEEADNAVKWAVKKLRNYADTVYLQDVRVPKWERGSKEVLEAKLGNNTTEELDICALGGSVATPKSGIKGDVIEVKSVDELAAKGKDAINGKIVFFNGEMDPAVVNTYEAYSQAVPQRVDGPSEAAKYGAEAVIVRSLTHKQDDVPHTGVTEYQESYRKIPAVAVSTIDADFLSRAIASDESLELFMELDSKYVGEVGSHNVIAEIKGSKFPNEYITIGAHLDSWDLGQGAHDNGAGVVHVMEVLRTFKKLNIQPQRTLRVVLFMNEENGSRGAERYATSVQQNREKHLVAIESDAGGFAPRGFAVGGQNIVQSRCVQKLQSWSSLFDDYGVCEFNGNGGGADINKLESQGFPLIGFRPDNQRYFDYHHCESDVFEAVNKRELEQGAAAITMLVYLVDKYGVE